MCARRPASSNTTAVGVVGELMLGAEATSRGCQVFYPSGGSAAAIDLVVVTPTHRKLAVQVKTQSTQRLRTVDLGEADKTAVDVVAVFGAAGGWFLLPAEDVRNRRTLNPSEVKPYANNWRILL
jgi:hypothetical protein